jgi:hypothetical protein
LSSASKTSNSQILLQRRSRKTEEIGNNKTGAEARPLKHPSLKQETSRAKEVKHMNQSKQITNKNQFVRKSPCRLSLAPWAAAIGLAVAMCLSPSGAFALITNFPSWEVASEFNDCNNADSINPSGVWSYGWKPTTLGALTLFTNCFTVGTFPDVSGWTTTTGYPHVSHNVHAVTTLGSGAQATLPPRALVMHPGPAGEYAVVRFTPLFRGTYKLSGQFYALDNYGTGTNTDVSIIQNNVTTVFSNSVKYYGGAKFASFTSKVIQMQVGDYIDFEVGFGADLTYSYDSTGLNAVIEKIK